MIILITGSNDDGDGNSDTDSGGGVDLLLVGAGIRFCPLYLSTASLN